ncbi:hypothetical protein ATN84_25045 [Paramesorhizobium deserti]|uniref:Uncharacterized protein n=1 Tax=Paramesorhizobium deserti TaxID=1494590 RepID=A0A135HXH1_9HYPH|nr:hypothetical protein ATN84_25045 [Paramesorhizobium deserti]
MVRISPDGQWIAFQAPIDGVLNLWIAPAEESERARPLTNYVGIEGSVQRCYGRMTIVTFSFFGTMPVMKTGG